MATADSETSDDRYISGRWLAFKLTPSDRKHFMVPDGFPDYAVVNGAVDDPIVAYCDDLDMATYVANALDNNDAFCECQEDLAVYAASVLSADDALKMSAYSKAAESRQAHPNTMIGRGNGGHHENL